MKKLYCKPILSGMQNSDNNVGQKNDVSSTSQAIVKLINYSNVFKNVQGDMYWNYKL